MECLSDSQTAQQSVTTNPAVAVDIKLADKDGNFAAETPTTVSRLFQKAVAMFPDHSALRHKTCTAAGGTYHWEELTYSQYYSRCLEAARAYIEVCYTLFS